MILTIVVFLAAVVVAVINGPPPPTYTQGDNGKSITLNAGDTFEVQLPGSPTSWRVVTPASAVYRSHGQGITPDEVLAYVDFKQDCKHDFHGYAYDCGPETRTFRATGKGQVQLRLDPQAQSLNKPFTLNITVK